MIPIKILIIFCGDLKGALGVHPQSLLSGGLTNIHNYIADYQCKI